MLGRLLATFVLMSCSAAAETELDQFFPSNPIHEDDRLNGVFEARIEGCRVKLTKKSRSSTIVRMFDVQDYQTDPGHLFWPYGKHLSTRYNMTWLTRRETFGREIDELNAKLRDLNISWRDQRSLNPSEMKAKSIVLESWLSAIRSGSHGSFAQRNHTAVYLTEYQGILTSVRINNTMDFPVQSGDMPALAHSMYRHALTCGED